MDLVFVEGKYKKEVLLDDNTLKYLKDKSIQTVALFTSVQFLNSLEKIKQQLKKIEITVITTKPKRAHCEGQLLGCDCYADSLNLDADVDCFFYLGDGKFHPLALVYGQMDVEVDEFKEVICFNPLENKMSVLDKKEIEKIQKRRKGALVKFHSSSTVGVIVTIKPGQEQLKSALKLEMKFTDKKFYYFLDNNISFDQLENFPFVEVWVNTACPRIGLDDCGLFRRGVVGLKEIFPYKNQNSM